MIAHLGSVALQTIKAATSLSLQVGFDYANHDKPLGKPSQQRLGGKLDTWRLQFSLHYQFCEPQESLDAIKVMVADGQPVPLIFNYIDYQGNVTVNDLDVTFYQTAINGKPLIIEGSLVLTEYVGEIDTPVKRPAVRKQNKQTPIQATSGADKQQLVDNTQHPFAKQMGELVKQFQALKNSSDNTIDKARALQRQARQLIVRR